MSDVTDDIRSWGGDAETKPSLRWQAELIRYLVAVGEQGAGASLSLAQADTLDATADGWDECAEGIDERDGEVENPDA